MTAKKTVTHVVCGNDEFRCLHCGVAYRVNMPISITSFSVLCDSFVTEHRKCKPSTAGAKRMQATTPEEWLRSWDTGTSSETIWSFMTGYPVKRRDVPYDPDDFGRCYRLLQMFPEWKARLPDMAKVFPTWLPLVEKWAVLERLYEQELPSGKAPQLYAAMTSCLKQAGIR